VARTGHGQLPALCGAADGRCQPGPRDRGARPARHRTPRRCHAWPRTAADGRWTHPS